MGVYMKRYIHNDKGITLVEVIIALVVIGIAGAILVPSSGIVHKSRLKSLASQLSMDIQKIRFFAQTHENTKIGDSYEYKIVFESLEDIDGNWYYNRYKIEPEVEGLRNPSPITDSIVKIRPIAKDDTGDKVIHEIQFDHRGRIQVIAVGETSPISFSDLTGTGRGIQITIKINNEYKKEITVNPLTGSTLIID